MDLLDDFKVYQTVNGRTQLDPIARAFTAKYVVGTFDVFVTVALLQSGALASRLGWSPQDVPVPAPAVPAARLPINRMPLIDPHLVRQ